jgi:hypothetical protein
MTPETVAAVLIAFQVVVLLMLGGLIGLAVLLYMRIRELPGSAINTRSILGAVEAVRVTITGIADRDEDDVKAIRAKLAVIVTMLDVYVLRITKP